MIREALFFIFAVQQPVSMKKHFFILWLALVSIATQAQIPNGYYDNALGKTGDELKLALHSIIKGHHIVSYGGLLDAFAYTDCDSNGKIWDIYSNYHYSLNGVCGSYQEEGDCWNREHTWPQSWFNESSTPRSDLFHVYPTDGFVNGQRSNYPYGEVNHPSYTSGNGSKLGPCVTPGYSGKVFEPIDEYKGDIARSYFYMSVRYYSEDSSWGTSGMTNKSEILPWAMTMLLRWSDEDPVSQKEMDRNNAIYGYQNNRNPFIDHPEYARMIWDPNWTQGNSYSITCATGLQNGSISAPANALEGSTVVITATPDPGFTVNTYSVYKTDDPNTTVAVSSNGTFTMPSYAVTVSATFMQDNTFYNITLGAVSHGSISASTDTAKSGTPVSLTATPSSGYSLYAWYVYKTGDMNATVSVSNNSFIMPAFNVTVMATFVQGEIGNGDYVKVTSAPTDWSGEYLIVYENGNKAFNGGLASLDATGNTIAVTINNHTIEANTTTNAAHFTILPVTGGYSIQAASGKYIGNGSNSNALDSSNTPLVNTLSYNSGNVDIKSSGGAYLRYNANSGQERFRYFKSSTYTGQQAIQLYKKTANTAIPTHTIHFNNNGGEGVMNDQSANEFEPIALQANTFTKTGFVFDGWNTSADGSGDYYADEATITLLEDITLYAQWNPLFTITLIQPNHGNISVSATQAFEGTEIILTATPDPLYALSYWTVTDASGNDITVIENEFEMPASNVTVSAVFSFSQQSFVQEYQRVTSLDQLVAGRTYLIVNLAYGKALGTTQNNNNRSASAVTIEDDIISTISSSVCELTLGGSPDSWTFFDAAWGSQGGYLYAASSSANQLKTQASNNANGRWKISLNANGSTTIQAQGSYTHNLLKYNNTSDIFSCYTTGQLEVCLFRRTELTDYEIEQTVALNEGWNWWSTNLNLDIAQLEDVLAEATPNSTIIIKSKNNTTTYNGNTWRGSLKTLDVSQMYMINISTNCEIALEGLPINAADTPITLKYGSNWIGFPLLESMPIQTVFAGIEPVSGDNIKSGTTNATYNGTSWRGSLKNLEPGHGYIYLSKAFEDKTLIFSNPQNK